MKMTKKRTFTANGAKRLYLLAAAIGIIALLLSGCDNGTTSDSEGGGNGNSGGKIDYTANSIDALAAWLTNQPANAASVPYTVQLSVNDLTDFDALREALNASGRYVYLNLSGPITTIPEGAFNTTGEEDAGCVSLVGITIPNSVTSIGWAAFAYCTSLASVTIPDSVTSIEGSVFYYCSGLTSVTIPNRMTSIDYCTFAGCSGLTSITIPNSVTSIDRGAFSGSGLTSVTIPNSVTSIGDWAFNSCSGLTSVTFQGTSTNLVGYIPPFQGDLQDKYLAVDGGIGTYTTTTPVPADVWTWNPVWTKQP